MFKTIAPLIAASLLCLMWTAACRHSAGLAESDRAAIGSAQRNFVKFMNARDFKALAELYTEDAAILPPGIPAILGRAAIRTHMETSPPVSNKLPGPAARSPAAPPAGESYFQIEQHAISN